MAKYSPEIVKEICEEFDNSTKLTSKKHPTLDEVMSLVQRPYKCDFKGTEKEYEAYVLTRLPEIIAQLNLPKPISIERQVLIREEFKGIIDILIVHEDRTVSILEVKLSRRKSHGPSEQCKAIGQLLLYKSLVSFVGRTPPENIRLFLVDWKIHYRTLLMYSQFRLPVTLMEVTDKEVFIPYFHL